MVSGRYFFPKAPLLWRKWMPAGEAASTKVMGPEGRGAAALAGAAARAPRFSEVCSGADLGATAAALGDSGVPGDAGAALLAWHPHRTAVTTTQESSGRERRQRFMDRRASSKVLPRLSLLNQAGLQNRRRRRTTLPPCIQPHLQQQCRRAYDKQGIQGRVNVLVEA